MTDASTSSATGPNPAAHPPTGAYAAGHKPRSPWPALWALVIGFFMILVDTTIVSVANPAIKTALETNDRPVVIDFVVSADAMVWPMVPQGVSNSYVQYARDHSPAFAEQED